MNYETAIALVRICKSSSQDPTRQTLARVLLFRSKEECITLVATDGMQLAEIELKDAELANVIGDARVCFDNSQVKALAAAIKHKRGNPPVIACAKCEDGTISIRINNQGCETTVKLANADQGYGYTFPDYKAVYPKQDLPVTLTVSLDAEKLLSIVESLRDTKRNAGVKITLFGDAKGPMRLSVTDAEGNTGSGLLMPMRI
jgi:DNA polymerase III sliding clamp (beta) subunit (PCNA family)